MKRKLSLLVIALIGVMLGSLGTKAQSYTDIVKERKENAKLTKAQLNEKASKSARQACKKYLKEGWLVPPGALPLEKQLDRAYNMQMDMDTEGFPKYMMGEAMSVGENYDAAKMQALELAKQNLAGQIQTEITALIENTVSNNQLPKEQAASITESVMSSKNRISQSIGRVIPVIEMYRITKSKNKEVRVQIAYNADMAKEAAKKVIRQDMEKKGQKLHEELDAMLK